MKRLLLVLIVALALAGCQPEKVSKGAMFNAPKEPAKGWYMHDAPKNWLQPETPKEGRYWLEIVHA
jgi:uncharacterized protein YceK